MSELIFSTNYSSALSSSEIRDNIKGFTFSKAKNPSYSLSSPRWTILGRDNNYHSHEYDLFEYGRMIDTESFVSIAFKKKRTLMFKRGFELTSNNDRNLEYVKKRISEIEYVSDTSFYQTLKEIADNLISVHNVYIVKVRKAESSSGKGRIINGRSLEPVAAYYCIPPEQVQVKKDKKGRVIHYRQYLSPGKYILHPVENIIHIYYNKRTGLTMGVPPLEAVKDDIIALRRIEESIETLIYKSLFPILHVKVGTPNNPAKVLKCGTHEVDIVTKQLKNIEDNGGITTSERVEIKAIGAESLALRVEQYLQHFKGRVFIGLGMSAVDFGESDSTGRATGEVLSESMKESVSDYQSTLSDFVTTKMFSEILVDGGFYPNEAAISEDDKVSLTFEVLDFNHKIKTESHLINCVTQKVISINEARKGMGRTELTDAEIKKMISESEPPAEQIKAPESKRASGSGLTKSITTPKNQHSSVSSDIVKASTIKDSVEFFNYSADKIYNHFLYVSKISGYSNEDDIREIAVSSLSLIDQNTVTEELASMVLDYGYQLIEEKVKDAQV